MTAITKIRNPERRPARHFTNAEKRRLRAIKKRRKAQRRQAHGGKAPG